jgi:hypothetical protein
MDSVVRAVIEAIHASPTHAVLFLSGGASQVISLFGFFFREFIRICVFQAWWMDGHRTLSVMFGLVLQFGREVGFGLLLFLMIIAYVVCGWWWNSICQAHSMCKKNVWNSFGSLILLSPGQAEW